MIFFVKDFKVQTLGSVIVVKKILTFLETPFIEYPHGSKRKSSITIPGMILLIPDF